MKIMFRTANGATREVEAQPGQSIMELAVHHGIPEIVAQCGGGCSCATCHCYIDPAWPQLAAPASEMEDMLLDGVMAERRATSRLGCQVVLDAGCDGLIVDLPDEQ
ncbi:2Fe-2S iron-sulfur cluster-binding protein [Gemmobacter nectariphilus]|uniref:2Fe-2S iron-sulfur cluster-binding protein n=1 Tax=Gemmobacter nectariphilus TaxID=220343 RepID=UPI0003F8C127|nr:2Fe-2S iron-sulfur cluster-binding protein [Gemmobacter nectariphilus]